MKDRMECYHFDGCTWSSCNDCTSYVPNFDYDSEYAALRQELEARRREVAAVMLRLQERRQAICSHLIKRPVEVHYGTILECVFCQTKFEV